MLSPEEDSGGGGLRPLPSSRTKRKRFVVGRLADGGCQVGANWRLEDGERRRRRTRTRSSYSMQAKETHVKVTTTAQKPPASQRPAASLKIAILLLLLSLASLTSSIVLAQVMMQSDPRPTIYSGQVSFGLLLSAHSPMGAELSSSASQQVISRMSAAESSMNLTSLASSMRPKQVASPLPVAESAPTLTPPPSDESESELEDLEAQAEESRPPRQIFENAGNRYRGANNNGASRRKVVAREQAKSQKQPPSSPDLCSQVNPNALYAGMGAIWASHQANLVGDSHLAIGTYVYDSCNDLDVGQRQSVRIVSNLNAFQQTTCESPRGSPISLTIAHGDNQLRAIQLLTSFRVPVITTREHFALDDYPELTSEQRAFLFTTAPSSRHLAQGAIRFARQIVSKSIASAKLANGFDKKSPKQGLIVISRNLPARFIAYLDKEIPHYVNYEILHSAAPIDQIRSVEQVESILNSRSSQKVEESRQVTSRSLLPLANAQRRFKRNEEEGEADPSNLDNADKMISPTILMFITPSEAIDLVTRLRNDLNEVSRYFSLIVATREDLSPALKTIFHRGGSRLCSGKAFYTISPKPDDIGEFSRYFRDTVQMEGDSSDHPLICEFARHQAASRSFLDLDDISTEPVIKAVWAAAAAFKSVHRRECSAHLQATSAPSSSSTTPGATSTTTAPAGGGGKHQRQAGGPAKAPSSAHQECMIRMNKNMSSLVQRALRKLDVSINSTGLQSLDGFRIKFDNRGELMTNKFGINYINKECEITEIGQFTGHDRSHLVLDKESMDKSLEGSMPEPWPVHEPKLSSAGPTTPVTTTTTSRSSNSSGGPATVATTATSTSTSNPEGETPASEDNKPRLPGSRKRQSPEPTNAAELEGANEEEEEERPRARKRSRDAPRRTLTPTTTTKMATDMNTTKAGRKLKPFLSPEGTTMKDWLPPPGNDKIDKDKDRDKESDKEKDETSKKSAGSSSPPVISAAADKKETTSDMTAETSTNLESRTTQAPHSTRSTLPESDGDTDVDSVSVPPLSTTKSLPLQPQKVLKRKVAGETQVAAHSAQDYVTAPTTNSQSFYRSGLGDQTIEDAHNIGHISTNRTYGQLREFGSTRSTTTPELNVNAGAQQQQQASSDQHDLSGAQRARLRAHIKWIYSSWYALSVLGANICGALMTLYVLTFLLMKNCDGHLDRENQGLRSMHLLAIIVVFFGSTLFIVYPTPGLCLLRSSWHNFALVLLFGSLLLDAMQTRSLGSLGLGGRPNRLNQFLTLLFIVGVQVAFELQRWKYESANYLNFVQQYFGPSSSHQEDNRKLMILNSAISDQFNPLTSFNDQVTPVSIQVSEHYQNLLQDYCLQQADDFLQGQIYLCLIVLLLFLFSLSNWRQGLSTGSSRKLTAATLATTSGRLVASQHEANLTDADLVVGAGGGGSPSAASHFHFTPNTSAQLEQVAQGPNMFLVSSLATLAYTVSVLLHAYGQNTAATNRDLISSVTMVFVAFLALVGIFLPILIRIHRFRRLGALVVPSEDSFAGLGGGGGNSDPRRALASSHHTASAATSSSSLSVEQQANKPFNMFPEFAPTGLRRPSSASGDTSASSGSRRLFAETKESRRNMSAALAQLGPSEDSLRSMGFYTGHRGTSASLQAPDEADQRQPQPQRRHQAAPRKPRISPTTSAKTPSGSEKRLIMLDVDPCCPRHGLGAWPTIDESSSSNNHNHNHNHNHRQL